MHHAVRISCGFRIVGNHHNGLAQLVVEAPQHTQNVFRILGVQVTRGLIGQQYFGLVDYGPGDGHPLLLASREFRRAMAHSFAEAEHAGDDLEAVRIESIAMNMLGDGDIAKGIERGQKIKSLEHKAYFMPSQTRTFRIAHRREIISIIENPSFGRLRQSPNHIEQSRFTTSRGAHDGHKFAWQDMKIYSPESRNLYFA